MENLIDKVRGGPKTGRSGIFHIKCLEDILDLSSPAVLPHITHSRTGTNQYRLDIGAASILKAWDGKCEMDNMVTMAINVTTTDDNISSTSPATATISSASAPAPSTSSPSPWQGETLNYLPDLNNPALALSTGSTFQWQGKNLIYLPDLIKKRSADVESYSWYHDREALFAPWCEDIVTDKLPRLPSNGGFILEDDAFKYFLDDSPWRTADGNLWSILSYLPHEPSQWRAKHALSESLENWWKDKVHGQLLDFWDVVHTDHRNIQKPFSTFLEGPEEEQYHEREKRLGCVSLKVRDLTRKVEPRKEATAQSSFEAPSEG